MTVRIVVVSHSDKIADGAVELAAQMAPDVMMVPAGGTSDGRIGTSMEKVMAALETAAGADGVVVLTDLGSAVMTAESAMEFAEGSTPVLLADAPIVEG
ncbi:MAG TPA: dihydroxyacetone kinase phosphoryl donor subunit DhaM, partial [Arthrobacter sp.]|nr:dihydroxyacetone kinase phosphoryl donor subunit DhaM [Arthrobacter sp.]